MPAKCVAINAECITITAKYIAIDAECITMSAKCIAMPARCFTMHAQCTAINLLQFFSGDVISNRVFLFSANVPPNRAPIPGAGLSKVKQKSSIIVFRLGNRKSLKSESRKKNRSLQKERFFYLPKITKPWMFSKTFRVYHVIQCNIYLFTISFPCNTSSLYLARTI